ncbi:MULTISPECIES: Cu(I)-responsive transcriptional regulator [Hyphobacterium]|uniref:Cu(I)-responsive transcriptional regulator n=1 Tax=Hyphobacterium vulgare TaxID=1736751 RepID=A0ABV6ZVN0_9PROT
MNVNKVASLTGLPAKTIRYYEDIGLVSPQRSDNGYRVFAERDVRRLQFVGRARSLGFSLDDCRLLLGLWDDRERASSEVRALARQHIGDIDRKLAELRDMRRTLSELVQSCHGDDRPDCPIIQTLSGDETSAEE